MKKAISALAIIIIALFCIIVQIFSKNDAVAFIFAKIAIIDCMIGLVLWAFYIIREVHYNK